MSNLATQWCGMGPRSDLAPPQFHTRRGEDSRRGGLRYEAPTRRARPTPLAGSAAVAAARAVFSDGRLDGGDELVSPLREGADVGWRIGRIAQGGPHLRDGKVQPLVEIDEGVVAPDGRSQRVARDDVSCVLDQDRKDLRRLGLQLHDFAITAQLARCRVERKRAECRFDLAGMALAVLGIAATTSISRREAVLDGFCPARVT